MPVASTEARWRRLTGGERAPGIPSTNNPGWRRNLQASARSEGRDSRSPLEALSRTRTSKWTAARFLLPLSDLTPISYNGFLQSPVTLHFRRSYRSAKLLGTILA